MFFCIMENGFMGIDANRQRAQEAGAKQFLAHEPPSPAREILPGTPP
jgi:hypothetical protein